MRLNQMIVSKDNESEKTKGRQEGPAALFTAV